MTTLGNPQHRSRGGPRRSWPAPIHSTAAKPRCRPGPYGGPQGQGAKPEPDHGRGGLRRPGLVGRVRGAGGGRPGGAPRYGCREHEPERALEVRRRLAGRRLRLPINRTRDRAPAAAVPDLLRRRGNRYARRMTRHPGIRTERATIGRRSLLRLGLLGGHGPARSWRQHPEGPAQKNCRGWSDAARAEGRLTVYSSTAPAQLPPRQSRPSRGAARRRGRLPQPGPGENPVTANERGAGRGHR